MFKSIFVVAVALFTTSVYAQLNCNQITTLPSVTVNGTPVPTCVAGCPTIRPPRCRDLNTVFPSRTPIVPVPVDAYDAVSCTDISTLPTYTSKRDGKVYKKCVSKCANFRPPKCVDINKELN
jgi:hypothetical protein